eukprot:349990-Chlamydomonas_euryale.AAC.10
MEVSNGAPCIAAGKGAHVMALSVVGRCWSASGHWSLVTGHWSLVTGRWSLVTLGPHQIQVPDHISPEKGGTLITPLRESNRAFPDGPPGETQLPRAASAGSFPPAAPHHATPWLRACASPYSTHLHRARHLVRQRGDCHHATLHPRRRRGVDHLGQQLAREQIVAQVVGAKLHLVPVGSGHERARHHSSVQQQNVEREAWHRWSEQGRGQQGEAGIAEEHPTPRPKHSDRFCSKRDF